MKRLSFLFLFIIFHSNIFGQSSENEELFFEYAKAEVVCEVVAFYYIELNADRGVFHDLNCSTCESILKSASYKDLPDNFDRLKKEVCSQPFYVHNFKDNLGKRIIRLVEDAIKPNIILFNDDLELADSSNLKYLYEKFDSIKTRTIEMYNNNELEAINRTTLGLVQENAENENRLSSYSEKLTPLLMKVFTGVMGLTLLAMIILIFYSVFENSSGDLFIRLLSVLVGLLIILVLDVFEGVELSEIIARSFVRFNFETLKGSLPPIILSIVYFLIGLFISRNVKTLLITDSIKGTRILLLISTVVVFFFVELYITSIRINDFRTLLPNLTFVLGFAFYSINYYPSLREMREAK